MFNAGIHDEVNASDDAGGVHGDGDNLPVFFHGSLDVHGDIIHQSFVYQRLQDMGIRSVRIHFDEIPRSFRAPRNRRDRPGLWVRLRLR